MLPGCKMFTLLLGNSGLAPPTPKSGRWDTRRCVSCGARSKAESQMQGYVRVLHILPNAELLH
jgi:hypothetical protein